MEVAMQLKTSPTLHNLPKRPPQHKSGNSNTGDTVRPTWDEYFMATAMLISTRASCKHVRAGSVIVLDKRIIAAGYNGAACGVTKNCLENGCYKENSGIAYGDAFNVGKCIGVHAEMNALANLSREIHRGATLYTTVFPCPSCAKNLMAYNIKKIVYKRDYSEEESLLSKQMFRTGGVEIEQIDIGPRRFKSIVFNLPLVDFDVFSDKERKEHSLEQKRPKCIE